MSISFETIVSLTIGRLETHNGPVEEFGQLLFLDIRSGHESRQHVSSGIARFVAYVNVGLARFDDALHNGFAHDACQMEQNVLL